MSGMNGIVEDLRNFMLRSPRNPTLVKFSSRSEREDYSSRILQRLDVDVDDFAILNIHRIGIRAPVAFVSQQLATWGPRSSWWPNRLARLEASDRDLRHIRVYFLGRKKHFAGLRRPMFGLNVIPLFEMHALEIHMMPGPSDFDNARYMLYRCSGGYPVGIVVAYVRSPIAARGEPDESQFFFAVGFNFYGKRDWPAKHPVNFVWERIHNRVAANMLNRFKDECEARFDRLVHPAVGRVLQNV
jgi:hypothetical protein